MPGSLEELCLEVLVENVGGLVSLDGVPEDLCCLLFERVLQRGKLRPKVLDLFLETRHELLMQRIAELNIQELPPMAHSSRNSWLGEKPSLY